MATDGHRLSYAVMPVEGNFAKQEIIVPRKTVIELSKLLADTDEPISIDILANQVRFSFGNIELTSKVIDGKFPDYNRVIPTTHTKLITIDRLLLLSTRPTRTPRKRSFDRMAARCNVLNSNKRSMVMSLVCVVGITRL